MLPTPIISKFDKSLVYDPSEDSFLLLDALEKLYYCTNLKVPKLCVEIGSGSGIITSFLSKLFPFGSSFYLCTDINNNANTATYKTGLLNNVINAYLKTFLMARDLLSSLLPRLNNSIDLLIFNPPYVETAVEELDLSLEGRKEHPLYSAWAGGQNGMVITTRLLELLPTLLSVGGICLLVAIHYNQPEKITTDFLLRTQRNAWSAQIMMTRRAGNEILSIIKFERQL